MITLCMYIYIMYDNNEDGKCMQASWNSQGSSHRKPNWQHADCPNKSLWTPAFTNDANLIQCSLHVHYLFITMISRYLKDRLKDLRTKRREHWGGERAQDRVVLRKPRRVMSSRRLICGSRATKVDWKWIDDSTWFNMIQHARARSIRSRRLHSHRMR